MKKKPTKTHTHTFSSTKLLTRVTVADKLVLVNPFWWNNLLFKFNALFIRCFKLICIARVIDCLHRPQWRHQQILHSTVPYGRGIWEKESIIGVQWFQKYPNPRVHRSVGNSASLVSHWNGGPSGWDFSVPTEHQWWILFIPHPWCILIFLHWSSISINLGITRAWWLFCIKGTSNLNCIHVLTGWFIVLGSVRAIRSRNKHWKRKTNIYQRNRFVRVVLNILYFCLKWINHEHNELSTYNWPTDSDLLSN